MVDVTFEANNLDNTETAQETKDLSAFLSSPKMKYYLMENQSLGNAYLFSSSFFLMHGDIYSQVAPHDAVFSLLLGNFVFELSKSMREKFISILNGLIFYMLKDYPSDVQTSTLYPLKLHISCKSLRSTFYDSKTCLREHFPVPEVTMVRTEGSKYSFTTLLECLTHFLAFVQGTENVVKDVVDDFNGSIPVKRKKD